MNTAPTCPQPVPKQRKETTSIKTRGHLALLEWEETPVPSAMPSLKASLYRRTSDRWYSGGTLLLFVTTVIALAASLCG